MAEDDYCMGCKKIINKRSIYTELKNFGFRGAYLSTTFLCRKCTKLMEEII